MKGIGLVQVWICLDCGSSSPIINYNNIMFNEFGISNINATNNYWGANPANTEGILGLLDFIPYETAPIEEAGPE